MIEAVVFDAYGTLYDVQSVAAVVEAEFPGHGDYVTQTWRMKQLEYSWLLSMMGAYEDFWAVTQASLRYTLATLGLAEDAALVAGIAEAYNALTPYPDAEDTLQRLAGYKRAILSNGSPAMLAALVAQSGLARYLAATLSVDASRAYKPDPRAYALVEAQLGVAPGAVAFVSSNGFDVAGAKAFGFKVVRIERVTPAALHEAVVESAGMTPSTLYKAMRTQTETIGAGADVSIAALGELPQAITAL